MDRDALYREVTEKHGAALARCAATYEAEEGARLELLREIHASVWKSLALFDHRAPLRTWVYRVAHNVGTAHAVARSGVGEALALDRQIVSLSREGLDALVMSEITGLSPSKVALELHRLKAEIAGALQDRGQLPTAFTIAELQERGLDGAGAETSQFLERMLVTRRSDQLFRVASSALLIPLLVLIRPAVEHARWSLPFLFSVIVGVVALAGRQLFALGATTRQLRQLRLPDLPRLRWQPSLVLVFLLVPLGLLVFMAIDRFGEERAVERRTEQTVGTVTRCLDPRSTDPSCVSLLGDRRMSGEVPIARLPPAADCKERRNSFTGSAALGSPELALLEAVSLGEACPDEVQLPASVLRKNLLNDVIDVARKACLDTTDDALERCGVYARLACQGKSARWRERNEAFLTFLSLNARGEETAAWECVNSPVVGLLRAFDASTPDKGALTSFAEKDGAAALSGTVENLDDVHALRGRLQDIVRIPGGLGRVVARDGDGRVRVELLARSEAFELASSEVSPLFSRIEATSMVGKPAPFNGVPFFVFVLTLNVNRAALPTGSERISAPQALVEHYSAVTRAEPGNAEAWLALGYAHKARNKPQDAIEAFKKYLKLRPEAPTRKELENQIYFLGGP